MPLERVSLHVGTLHPQLIGFGWVWGQSDGLCDEFQVAEAALRSHAYRLNPLYRVIEYGEKVRSRPPIPLPSASRWIAWITAPRRRMLR
ncbi:MAG: hypothetical protein ACXWX7_08335 [Candidatus Binatia bacterium]